MKYLKYTALSLVFLFIPFGLLRLFYGRNPFPIVFQALPIPSTILGPPKGYIYAKETYPDRYTALIDAHQTNYPPFPLGNQKPELRFFPEVFVLELDNARVYGNNGLVITKEDKVLADTAIDWIPTIDKHKIFRKNALPKVEYVDETVAVIASKSSDCFFHWMFDILPRLEILKRSGLSYDKIYLNPLKYPFQKETIAQLGLDEQKIIWAYPNCHICAKKLIVPSLPGGPVSATTAWSCAFLQKQFLPNMPEKTNIKIYISRKLAPSRKIINEKELVTELEKLGFIEVCLEQLSIFDQAKLFASAECIVAPHGAGLTNLVFCRENTKLIEIFSPQYLNCCYWNLSFDKKLKHTCLLGSQEDLSEMEKKNDIVVNIDEILSHL